jgi:pyruvate dehydrogenase E2 component (dihydrolipoamide acetyltransferase)
LLYIGVEEGAVPVNAVLAVIGQEGEDYQAALDKADTGDSDDSGSATASESAAEPEKTASASVEAKEVEVDQTSTASDSERVKASPLARKMAEEAGIDISKVKGSGDQGRIVKRDIEAAAGGQQTPEAKPAASTQQQAAPAVSPSPPVTQPIAGASYEDVATSQMRKVIARRLAESKFGAPHFYLGIEVEMSNAIAYRKKLNEISDVKLSFNDLIVKSCAHALRKHPAINSSWLGDHIRFNHDVNIGVAVAVEDGLLVPVIQHADRKGMSEINQEVKALAGLAKERKLQPQQMQGNTFTISNLGMFDISEFTAIINPPDACILAVGSIKQQAIVKDGELAVGNVMKLTLSCDHRVVDGATGAKFLATLKGMLENPLSILI